jgi:Protein of unknown function (DUF2281)
MLTTTITGTYQNGQVFLEDIPKTKKKMKVFVTFMEEVDTVNKSITKRPFGILKGSVTLSDDFNETLDDLKEYM